MNAGAAILLIVIVLIASFAGLGYFFNEALALADKNRGLEKTAAQLTQELETERNAHQQTRDKMDAILQELESEQSAHQQDQTKLTELNQQLVSAQTEFQQSEARIEQLVKDMDVLTGSYNEATAAKLQADKSVQACQINKVGQSAGVPSSEILVPGLLAALWAGLQIKQSISSRQAKNLQLQDGRVTLQLTREQLGSFIEFQRKSGSRRSVM